MNTETLNALKLISDAKSQVVSELSDPALPLEEKQILGDVMVNLQDHENTLINFTLQDMIDKIDASNAGLQDLIQQMNDASANIAAISDTIKKISSMLSTLTEITGKALSAGLL
jgi:ABC-type transporter Mla subunit MlaD